MSQPVVLITGALTGIGRATAIVFAHQSARLVVSGRHEEAGQALAHELRDLGAEAEFVRADVRHDAEMSQLADCVVARFGRLDVAVNNAGFEGTPGPVTDVTDADYTAVFDTNVLSMLHSTKHALRVMQAQGSGSIINPIVDDGRARCREYVAVCREQACGRGHHQMRGDRGCVVRGAG